MEKDYREFESLPFYLDVSDLASFLRISKSAAYSLMHAQGFPVIRIGRRMIVSKERLKIYLDGQTGGENYHD